MVFDVVVVAEVVFDASAAVMKINVVIELLSFHCCHGGDSCSCG